MSATLVTKPHFFKPLLPGFEDDFVIPAAYSKHLKGQQCGNAMLGSRKGGKLWPVKINGRRFEDGWKEFVDDHQLQIGDFLVFRHDGGLVFYVLVFDRSTCEREYSPFNATEEENLEIQEEIFEDSSNNGKTMEEMEKTKTSSGATERENPCSVIQLTSNSLKKSRLHIPRKFAMEHGLDGRCCSMILKDEEGRCWPALLYKNSNGKTYVAGGWASFCVAHKLKAGDLLIIELTENDTIPVLKMRRLQEHREVKQEIMDFDNAEDDSLVPGHLHASTEASNLEKSHPQVPDGGAEKSGLGKETEKKKVERRCEAKASLSTLEYPSFVITLEQGNAKSDRVYIPQNFAREHGLYSRCSLLYLKDENGYCWPAKLLHSRLRSGATCVADGWSCFRIAHDLRSGDSVIFELIKFGMVPILKVRKLQKNPEVREEVVNQNDAQADSSLPEHVHAATEASNLEKSQPQIPDGGPEKSGCYTLSPLRSPLMNHYGQLRQKKKKKKKKKKGKTKFEGKAGFSGSQYPHFVMNFTAYGAKCPLLSIPMEFARVNGLKSRCCKVVLLSEHGMVRVARLGFKQRDGQAYIKDGWTAFRISNSIKEGDSCLFELIRDGEKPVLKITKCAQELKLNPMPQKESTNTALAGSLSINPRAHVTVHESYDNNKRPVCNNLIHLRDEMASKPEMSWNSSGKERSRS
ncbi:B3 domain-containing protein REM10 [Euphorbia peplus]|nr:B3 domain-containing protein REM10 [Euphorbia peplus]